MKLRLPNSNPINTCIASRYVQFSEYIGFVRTMDALRGMKLLRKEGDKNLAINIIVDFDTTKHLTETNIKRRQIIRDRLIMKENEKREEERRKAEEEEQRKEKERFDFKGIFFTFSLALFDKHDPNSIRYT